jgi:hypothetical protein
MLLETGKGTWLDSSCEHIRLEHSGEMGKALVGYGSRLHILVGTTCSNCGVSCSCGREEDADIISLGKHVVELS